MPPGSWGKVLVLSLRDQARVPLWHPDDVSLAEGLGFMDARGPGAPGNGGLPLRLLLVRQDAGGLAVLHQRPPPPRCRPVRASDGRTLVSRAKEAARGRARRARAAAERAARPELVYRSRPRRGRVIADGENGNGIAD
jgi:hypothetical protein